MNIYALLFYATAVLITASTVIAITRRQAVHSVVFLVISFLGSAMLFSATLFLSGTRLFVDPPAMPKLEGWLAAHARSFFIAERVLGAFFSILFFLAISGTVVR